MAGAGSGLPVGIGHVGFDLLDPTLKPHLPAQAGPVKRGRRMGRGSQLAALAAAAVGKKHKAVFVDMFEQDKADRGQARLAHRCQRHGFGLGHSPALGRGKPVPEAADRIVGHVPLHTHRLKMLSNTEPQPLC